MALFLRIKTLYMILVVHRPGDTCDKVMIIGREFSGLAASNPIEEQISQPVVFLFYYPMEVIYVMY